MKTLFNVFRFLAMLIAVAICNAITTVSPGTSFVRYAVVQNPITGKSRGKFGTAVFSKWKGLWTLRTYNDSPHDPQTTAQLTQRQKFSVIRTFVSKALLSVRLGFEDFQDGQTQFNEAMSRNMLGAITGAYPNFAVDYPNVAISDGALLVPPNFEATPGVAHTVDTAWDDNSGLGNALATDEITVVITNPDAAFSLNEIQTVARDLEGVAILCPEAWDGDTVYVHAFMSDIATKVKSITMYGGSVVVPAA